MDCARSLTGRRSDHCGVVKDERVQSQLGLPSSERKQEVLPWAVVQDSESTRNEVARTTQTQLPAVRRTWKKAEQLLHRSAPSRTLQNLSDRQRDQCTSAKPGRSTLVLCNFVDLEPKRIGSVQLPHNRERSQWQHQQRAFSETPEFRSYKSMPGAIISAWITVPEARRHQGMDDGSPACCTLPARQYSKDS